MNFGINFNPGYSAYNCTKQTNNFRKIGFSGEQDNKGNQNNKIVYDVETERAEASAKYIREIKEAKTGGLNFKDNPEWFV